MVTSGAGLWLSSGALYNPTLLYFYVMMVKIHHLNCGFFGEITECNSHLCGLCSNYNALFTEERDVSPQELVQLIKSFKYIIELKNT